MVSISICHLSQLSHRMQYCKLWPRISASVCVNCISTCRHSLLLLEREREREGEGE